MKDIVYPLLNWYSTHKRELPWRDTNNPYNTWISEIMLQQTRVEAVKDYFTRFTKAIPTIEALAMIDDDSLMKLWEGLGYYSRARNLKKCAIQCVEKYQGKLPNDYSKLLALPGIGPYTAGAISSIAFGLPKAAVDGNVLRVISRITNNASDITSNSYKNEVTHLIESLIPVEQPGNFNQAIMDLGATICIPNGLPRCNICPLAEHCQAKQAGTAHLLPNKPAKKARKIEQHTIIIIRYQSLYLLQKRPDDGLLANLYEFINIPVRLKRQEIVSLPLLQYTTIIKIKKLATSKHIFTHMEWHMNGYYLEVDSSDFSLEDNQIWVTKKQIEEQYTIPIALKLYRSYVFDHD